MKEKQALQIFSCLSQETRLKIIRHLINCGDDGDSAGNIGKKAKASASRASFHLAALEQAGVLRSSRVSRQIIYRVDFQKLGQLVNFLVEDCCQNDTRVKACCGFICR